MPNAGYPSMGLIDLHHLTVNAYHEARGESVEGILAVCKVVLVRMKASGKTAKEIIYQPYQFSWTLESGTFRRKWMLDPTDYLRIRGIVKQAISEFNAGNTNNDADHYHNIFVQPYWAAEMTKIKQIGNHIFYRS